MDEINDVYTIILTVKEVDTTYSTSTKKKDAKILSYL